MHVHKGRTVKTHVIDEFFQNEEILTFKKFDLTSNNQLSLTASLCGLSLYQFQISHLF